jgi:hypothetical protein
MIVPPWSFSVVDSFETCPEKYNAAKVARTFPDQQNEFSIWGNRVHKALEERLSQKKPLPEGMQQWEDIASIFDNPGGTLLVEHRYALNRQFGTAKWTDSWTRGIIDVGVVRAKKKRAKIYDWKTGKRKLTWQLKLSAAVFLHSFPYIDEVETAFVWLSPGMEGMDAETFTRDDLPMIWEEILPKVLRWENAYLTNKWEKRPSGLCNGWCSNKVCPFHKPRKSNEE